MINTANRPQCTFLLELCVAWFLLCVSCLGNAFHCRPITLTAPSSARSRRHQGRATTFAQENNDLTTKETSKSSERRVCIQIDQSNTILLDSRQSDESFAQVASELSTKLNLPVACTDDLANDSDSGCYTHAIVVVPYTFESIMTYAVAIQELVASSKDSKQSSRQRRRRSATKSKPFYVDFLPPSNTRLGKRFQGQSGSDLLVKAVSASNKAVYDLTAGLGQDSLLMAQGGALRVTMVERDPIVAALLQDGLRRLNLVANEGSDADPQTRRARELSEKLPVVETGDAIQVANSILEDPSLERPDVCYLDPMFPSRRKSAAVKKNMQILHGLLGTQSNDISQNECTRHEEQDLLDVALSLARERVVVKRPIGADRLGASSNQGIKPSYEIKGSVNRWDVYVK